MQVVWELSLQKISEMKLLPDNLNIVAKFYDDHCDQSHAMISAMDGHFDSCGDVIFGPVCDYALGKILVFSAIWNCALSFPIYSSDCGENSKIFTFRRNAIADAWRKFL